MADKADYKRRVWIRLLYIVVLIQLGSGESCDRKSTCSCECSGGTIDLKDLESKDGPSYKDQPDQTNTYKYSYNPCKGFTEDAGASFEDHCHDVAACQIIDLGSTFQYYDTGTQDSVEFYTAQGSDVGISVEGEVVVAKYTARDNARQTEVVLVCNTDDDQTAFAVVGELPDVAPTYRFVLVSPNCCYVNESISAGSIMIIVFFSVIFLYLVGMVIFLKFVKKSSGKDLIPHRQFWTSIPGLAKDGVLFIFRRSAVKSERVPLK